MATAILINSILLIVVSRVQSLNVATLTFSKAYPNEHEQVDVKCDSAIVGNRNDLSKLIFYAVDTDYKYTLQRNCATNEILYDEYAFGHTIDWSEGNDGKIYLIWTQLTTKYNGMQFQCSISKCTTDETAVSNSKTITVLPDVGVPEISPLTPYVTAATEFYNYANMPISCSGFVGYPGGNLEILVNESTGGVFNVTSLANFSANSDGLASGKIDYYLFKKNRSDIEKTRAQCVASNTVNQNIQPSTTLGNYFKAAYAPTKTIVTYSGEIIEPDKFNGQFIIIRTAPLREEVLQCGYDDSLPASTAYLYISNKDVGNKYGVKFTSNSSDSVTISYYGNHPNVHFELSFSCDVTYESDATTCKELFFSRVKVQVSSMGTTFHVCYLLLFLTLAITWKL